MSTQTDQNVRVEVEPPRVENGKTLLIAGLRGPLETSASIPALWQRLMAHKIPNQVGRVAYGVCFNCRDGADNSEYLAGIEVSNFSGLPAELSHLSIPPRKYIVFPHRGHVSELWHTCDKIRKWLPQSGYGVPDPIAGAPDFVERYDEDFDPQTGRGGIEVWIPIKG